MSFRRFAGAAEIQSSAVLIGGLGLVQLLGLGTGVITARSLGPVDRGALALVMLLPLVFGTLGDLGVDRAAAYFAATIRDRRPLASSLLVLSAAQSILATCAAVIFTWLILGPRGQHLAELGTFACVIVPLSILSRYGQAQLQGRLRIRALALARISDPTTYLLLLVGLIATGHLTVATAIGAKLLSQLVIIGWSWLLTVRGQALSVPSMDLIRSLLSYGLRGYFRQLSFTDTFLVDQWAVGLWFGSAQLAFYVVALGFLNVARVVPTAIATMILPMYATDQRVGVRRLAVLGSVLAAAVATAVAVLVSRAVPLFFGTRFVPAIGPAQILALGSAALAMKELGTAVIYGRGRPGQASLVELACGGGLVFGLFVFPMWLQTSGVALAVASSYIFGALLAFVMLAR